MGGQKARPQSFIVQFIFIVALMLLLSVSIKLYQNIHCSEVQAAGVPSSNWQIQNSTLPSEILWERTITVADSLLTSSGDTVVFHRGTTTASSECGGGEKIIALDSRTGEERWNYPAQIARRIVPLTDGYLIALCCMSILRLDSNGGELWESATFPERMFLPYLSPTNDSVYFRSGGRTYQISLADGTLIQTLENEAVLAVFDQYVVKDLNEGLLEITNRQGEQSRLLLHLNPDIATINYGVHYTENTLIIFSRYGVSTYELNTGQMLWSISERFEAVPLVIGNTIIVYDTNNRLRIYSVQSGQQIGELVLSRIDAGGEEGDLGGATVQLAYSENRMFILYKNSLELVALDFATGFQSPSDNSG